MNLIYLPQDKAFSVIGRVSTPGQTTPIHDHLTWALIGVYDGRKERLYSGESKVSPTRSVRELRMASETTNGKGHVTVLGELGIHRVDNPYTRPAYSVHVYGRGIGPTERHSYDPVTGETSGFVSGHCNVPGDEDIF